MNDRSQFEEFASSVSSLCNHVSVREDEDGPYVFALGLDVTHTLQIRTVGENYLVQLWHGPDAEQESVVGEPVFFHAQSAFDAAREWLQRAAK
jgi:hypothetical protein